MRALDPIRAFVVARGLSVAGDVAFQVAALAHLFGSAESTFHGSFALSLNAVAYLITLKWASSRIQLWEPVRVMVLADLWRAIVLMMLAIRPDVWTTVVCSPLLALGGIFFMPASQRYLRDKVGSADLLRVNSVLSGTENVVKVLMPAWVGLAMAAWDFRVAVGLNLVSYLASALILHGTAANSVGYGVPGVGAGTRAEQVPLRGGDGTAGGTPYLFASGVFGLANGVATVAFASLILRELGRDYQEFGASYSIAGAGLILGSLIAGKLKPFREGGGVWMGLGLAGVSWLTYWIVPEAFWGVRFLESASISVFFVHLRTVLQKLHTPATVGAVFVKVGAIENSARLLGLVLAGFVLEAFLPSTVYLGIGLAAVAAMLTLRTLFSTPNSGSWKFCRRNEMSSASY